MKLLLVNLASVSDVPEKRRVRWQSSALARWLRLSLITITGLCAIGAYADTTQLRSIASIVAPAGDTSNQNVVVRGSVTLSAPGILIIQDQTSALRVEPIEAAQAAIGDEVEVSGRMDYENEPILHGKVKRLWSGSTPLPIAISPDRAAEGQFDLDLVQVTGTLNEVRQLDRNHIELRVEGEHQFYLVLMPSAITSGMRWPTLDSLRKALQPGTVLEFTGILEPRRTLDSKSDGSFAIMLRSAEDIRVLSGPPWWTPVHLLWIFAGIAVIAFAGVVLHIRNLRLRFRAVMEERSRIARDIHDTMAQGFAGIALQLQAAEQVLTRDAASAAQHLALGLQMVRHSRSESHLAIQTLRALSRSESLQNLLRQSATQMTTGTDLRISLSVQGSESRLPYEITAQLYRIGQEAVANAVRHAQASHIRLRIEYRKTAILLEVEDDGIGFNAEGVLDEMQHFGLVGMRERVEALRGKLAIQSSRSGTCLTVEVPRPAHRKIERVHEDSTADSHPHR
ncbi:sensor histidine kinase [Acidipila rosea]|nr:sensor histidine kinase [Acidipila rosea]MBW4026694.1 sensor histidine kinase [Acidobacteriota bacterium]MBW4044871.1 sensor histidine kinase [Acidobacteriota bacterium]